MRQPDLFVANALCPSPRDARDCMEYPFLALQKGRTAPIVFDDGKARLEVVAMPKHGIASIWDWDLIIYAASHLNDAVQAGHAPAPTIRFAPRDALTFMRRGTGGRDYKELAKAVRRLRMTNVTTTIRQADIGEERSFSWLTTYRIPTRYNKIGYLTADEPLGGDVDASRPWEIMLSPWVYEAIIRQTEILAVHPDYFDLSGGLERWLYRLARKAVPEEKHPPVISFNLITLHRRSGTTREMFKFVYDLRGIAERQPLPEYGIEISGRGSKGKVVLFKDPAKPKRPSKMERLWELEERKLKKAS